MNKKKGEKLKIVLKSMLAFRRNSYEIDHVKSCDYAGSIVTHCLHPQKTGYITSSDLSKLIFIASLHDIEIIVKDEDGYTMEIDV